MKKSSSSNVKIFVVLTLFAMILMRLVWMDLRSYSVQVDHRVWEVFADFDGSSVACSSRQIDHARPFFRDLSDLPSWEDSVIYRQFMRLSCLQGEFRTSSYVRMNQGLLVVTIICCVLISRFFARSWLVNLTVAAILLSRGRLIAANGFVSGQGLITCLITIWLCGVFHWVRTGSRMVMIFIGLLPFLLMGVDLSLTPLGMAIPFGLLVLYLLRPWYMPQLIGQLRDKKKQGVPMQIIGDGPSEKFWSQTRRWLRENIYSEPMILSARMYFASGGLFRSLKVPFLLWLQHHRKWKPIILSLVFLQTIQWFILIWLIQDSWYNPSELRWTSWFDWFGHFANPIDLDIAVSFGFLFLIIVRRPSWGLMGFWEACWFLVWSIVAAGLGTYLWDLSSVYFTYNLSQQHLRASEVLFWFEPVLLTFAVLSAYHFFHIISRKLIFNYKHW